MRRRKVLREILDPVIWILLLVGIFLFSGTGKDAAHAVTAPTVSVTGNLSTLFGTAAISQRVVYQYGLIQSIGGSVVPGGSACSVFTDASGNLPTTGNCTSFVQGSCAFVTIGSGAPVEIQFPYATTVDLSTLILANLDPPELISQIVLAGPYAAGAVVTNPALGQIGVATITWPICGGNIINSGSYSLDTSSGLCQGLTLESSSTISIVNMVNGQQETIYVVQFGSGGFTPTWAAPGGTNLVWAGQSPSTAQPFMPTTVGATWTKWTFTLDGSNLIGSLDGAGSGTAFTGPANTVLQGEGVNVAPAFSAQPTLGTNSGTGGQITFNGATSGRAVLAVPAAAGTPVTFNLPTNSGAVGSALQNDGSGNSSWQPSSAFPAGTSLHFGGASFINASVGVGNDGIFHATRNLTVDNCYGAWPALGGCGTFPVIRIRDATASTTICSATGDNTGNTPGGASQTVVTSSITSGDTLIVDLPTAPVSCAANAGNISIGMVYH